MKKIFIIGIDPGKNGGIVSLTNGKITTIDAMPSNIEALWNHFVYLGFPNNIDKENTYVFIEKVHAMPTDSRVSAFSFGRHVGHLDVMACKLMRMVHIIHISPREWQTYFRLAREVKETSGQKESKYDYKKRILGFANSLHSKRQLRLLSAKNRTHSQRATMGSQLLNLKTCDAYLIALYGYNQIKGQT